MVTQTKKQIDESLIDFYNDHIVTQSDVIYRFAFCLTLSLDTAMQIVKSVFDKVARELSPSLIHQNASIKSMLLTETWNTFQRSKTKKSSIPSLTLAKQATKFFESLEIDARAALFFVDIAGLSVADACRSLGMPEEQIRNNLGIARKNLVNTSFDF